MLVLAVFWTLFYFMYNNPFNLEERLHEMGIMNTILQVRNLRHRKGLTLSCQLEPLVGGTWVTVPSDVLNYQWLDI